MESNHEFTVVHLSLNVVTILNELSQFILLSKKYVCIYKPCKYRVYIQSVHTHLFGLQLCQLIKINFLWYVWLFFYPVLEQFHSYSWNIEF